MSFRSCTFTKGACLRFILAYYKFGHHLVRGELFFNELFVILLYNIFSLIVKFQMQTGPNSMISFVPELREEKGRLLGTG